MIKLDVNILEIMSDPQKDEISEVYKNKIIDAIKGIPVGTIRKIVINDINESFENEIFINHLDSQAIGKAITKKITDSI